jgi:apolipoprotein N-acyltransferase
LERSPLPFLEAAWTRRSVLLLSGVAGALAFPTTDWPLLAWVWLVPAFCCALWRAPRAALGDGWLAGTGFFVVLLRWLDFTFQSYSSIPWPLTWLPITALAAWCGLYVGMVACIVAWLRPRLGAGWALAMAPPLWVAGEWIRGWLLGGFPWGLLGYSQHTALPVIQIAELGGVYAVSMLLVAVNAAIAGGLVLGPRRAAVGGGMVALALALALGFGWITLSREFGPDANRARPSVQISVIQPSIEQGHKRDPA